MRRERADAVRRSTRRGKVEAEEFPTLSDGLWRFPLRRTVRSSPREDQLFCLDSCHLALERVRSRGVAGQFLHFRSTGASGQLPNFTTTAQN